MTEAAPRSPRANAFTVDVEEWFHICGVGGALGPARWDDLPTRVVDTTRRVLDELDRAGVRATFFVLGWVADRYPDVVTDILAAGHEVGSHGYAHERAYDLGTDRFAEDVSRSLRALRSAGAGNATSFRAPEWSINDRSLWALDVLARAGFTRDASMAPLRVVGRIDYPRHPHVRLTEAGGILELPPLVADRFGHVIPLGWGWGLRMSSPASVLRAIQQSNDAGTPAVVTIHPWEIDPDPPRVPLPPRLWFAHYFRLGGFRERLAALLRGADFGALADIAACP
jgi:peptidoglycan-N-acetylglucosamine deacetylase